jgi:hypothetical protein
MEPTSTEEPLSADDLRVAVAKSAEELKRRKRAMIPDAVFLGILVAWVALALFRGTTLSWVDSFLFVLLFTRLGNQWSYMSSGKVELSTLQARLEVAARLDVGIKADDKPVSYFDKLVRLNIDNLASYYGQVSAHTESSFRISITVGVIGFMLVGVGLVFGYASGDRSSAITYISAATGIITEVIAGVFFVLYNRTVLQMREYHDKLIEVQNVLLALKVVEDTQGEEARQSMMVNVLSFLVKDRRAVATKKAGDSGSG